MLRKKCESCSAPIEYFTYEKFIKCQYCNGSYLNDQYDQMEAEKIKAEKVKQNYLLEIENEKKYKSEKINNLFDTIILLFILCITKAKKITIKLFNILMTFTSWFFSIVFLTTGIMSLITQGVIGVPIIIMGLIHNRIVQKFLKIKNIKLTFTIRWIITFIMFIIFGIIVPK